MATSSQETTAAAARSFDAAHAGLMRDGDIQFDLRAADPPPKPPAWIHEVSEWIAWALRPIGRALSWLLNLIPDAPYARFVFWSVLAVVAGLILWLVVDRVLHGRWYRRRRRPAEVANEQADSWTPDQAPARSWLREADALAADGRFAEAVHHLLFRSIEDIGNRRPNLVRPALTSRDIAQADAIPPTARTIFADIARIVERSLFGGRPVGADDWTQARTAYADFALAGAWT
ncbi:MAG: DUF4129 domain-containing protein [Pseudomonadota bacterium]